MKYLLKSLAIGLTCNLFCQYTAPPARAQEQPTGLNIVIVEGEGAVNNSRQHVTNPPIVRVEDENHRPLAGVSVVFTLPTEGTTGTFANGSQTLFVTTDSNGLAAVKTLRVNPVTGKLPIHVSASLRGLSARATINQENEGIAGAKASTSSGGHGKLIAIVAVIGAAAGGGAYYATHKSSSSSTPTTPTTPTTAIGITAGTSVIIGPH